MRFGVVFNISLGGLDTLKHNLDQAALEKQVAEKALTDQYEVRLKDRDGEIERLKEFKAKLSTKMVGETLEKHCETEFNRIRATAFRRQFFQVWLPLNEQKLNSMFQMR